MAAPLIMGNDVRNVTPTAQAILLNKDAIKVNQDPKGQQGACSTTGVCRAIKCKRNVVMLQSI